MKMINIIKNNYNNKSKQINEFYNFERLTVLILFLLYIICPINAFAGVIYQQNFDSLAEWSPAQPQKFLSPTEPSAPPSFYSAVVAPSIYENDAKHNTMNITGSSSEFAYGGTGKSFVYWNETEEPNGDWDSDGLISIKLTNNWNDGYDELWITYYIKFQSGWRWHDDGIISPSQDCRQKFLHVSHYTGVENWYDYHSLTENKPRYVSGIYPSFAGKGPLQYYALHSKLNETSETFETNFRGGCRFNESGCPLENTWQKWEIYLKMNSADGKPDGVSRFYSRRKSCTRKNKCYLGFRCRPVKKKMELCSFRRKQL